MRKKVGGARTVRRDRGASARGSRTELQVLREACAGEACHCTSGNCSLDLQATLTHVYLMHSLAFGKRVALCSTPLAGPKKCHPND